MYIQVIVLNSSKLQFTKLAMTNYIKSKPKNIVHLSSCYSYMSQYICLSRSTCAPKLLLYPSVITGGCSGYFETRIL